MRVKINKKSITTKRTAAQATGGPNAPNWNQILALDSAVVEVQEIVSLHRSLYFTF